MTIQLTRSNGNEGERSPIDAEGILATGITYSGVRLSVRAGFHRRSQLSPRPMPILLQAILSASGIPEVGRRSLAGVNVTPPLLVSGLVWGGVSQLSPIHFITSILKKPTFLS